MIKQVSNLITFLTKNKFFIAFSIISVIISIICLQSIHTLFIMIGILISIAIDKYNDIKKIINTEELNRNLNKYRLSLKENELKFRTFFNVSNTPMCIFNRKTKMFIEVNKAFCDILEYTPNELTTTISTSFITQEDYNMVNNHIDHTLVKEEQSLNFECSYITKNGKTITLIWNSNPMSDGLCCCIAREKETL